MNFIRCTTVGCHAPVREIGWTGSKCPDCNDRLCEDCCDTKKNPRLPMNQVKKRCGHCKNCLHIERTKTNILQTVNPPFTSLGNSTDKGQGVIDFWNRELEEHPCTGEPA